MNKQILINIKLKKKLKLRQQVKTKWCWQTIYPSPYRIHWSNSLKGKGLYICTCAWYMVGKCKGWSWQWCGVSVILVFPNILS